MSPSQTIQAIRQARPLESLSIWQGVSTALIGALATAVMGVNTLTERSAADQARVKDLIIEVRTLAGKVDTLSYDLSRQSAYVNILLKQKGLTKE